MKLILKESGTNYLYKLGVMLVCVMSLSILSINREMVFFRDYSITFEGSYRLYLGQIPYKDFFSPVGPGAFIIPAVFFHAFSPNWNIFLASQQFINLLLILVLHLILVRLEVQFYIHCISLVVFTIFYLLFQTHPWYNTTATLLLFAGAWCSLSPRIISVICSGLFVGMAVLTKQDFGLLGLVISGLFIVLMCFSPDSFQNQFRLDYDSMRATALTALNKVAIYICSVVFVISTFVFLTDSETFLYWFNYGQPPHDSRLSMHWGMLKWLVALAPGLFFKNLKLLFCSIIFTAALITRTTSGLEFTHFYYVAFVPVFIDELFKIQRSRRYFFLLCVSILLFFSLVVKIKHPITSAYYVFEAMLSNQPEHFNFNYRDITGPLAPFPDSFDAFSARALAPHATIATVSLLKQDIRTLSRSVNTEGIRVLNMTELTPIYAELHALPPRNIPLWFHSKITLFDDQIEQLNSLFKKDYYDLILIQGTHEGMSPVYFSFLSTLNANSAYVMFSAIKGTPRNFTCSQSCEGDIFIYKKRQP